MSGVQDALFLYGTLMPGHLRWPLVEPHVVDRRAARAPGVLHDTGRGWPAATFHLPARGSWIPGWAVRIPSTAAADLLWELDRMEGISEPPDPATDPYTRIRVELEDGTGAWAYHAAHVEPGWTEIEAWSGSDER